MILILSVVIAALLCYIYLIKPHRYWRDKGVNQTDPVLIFGDTWKNISRKESITALVRRLYDDAGDKRYYGIYQFTRPTLLIKDVELLKQLAVKDFDHFQDHIPFLTDDTDPMWEKNLFALRGQKWKDMRATLSPSFTSSKMRMIFAVVTECGEALTKYFISREDDELKNLEMKDTFSRFGNDVIASVAFGIKCDSLGERENTFYMMGKAVTDFTSSSSILKAIIMMLAPKLSRIFNVRFLSPEATQFFRSIVTRTIRTREEKNIFRPDMLQLLIEARKNGMKYEEHSGPVDAGFATVEESDIGKSNRHITYKLTDDDITAQGLIFFLAGFDTVSAAMSFMAYELAVNTDIQERLIEEIDETIQACEGKLTYEALMKMKYLDMVVTETLRKWPPLAAVDRLVTKPYTIEPIDEHEKPVHLKYTDSIWIPISGLHNDPKYYPNPEKFDPERFNDDNKVNVNQYTYVPFGVGPRNCIGSRFALLEIKILMFHLLSKFNLVVTQKTQIPLKLNRKSFALQGENGIWLAFERRANCI